MALRPSVRIINLGLALTMGLGLSACVVYDRPYGPRYVAPMPPATGVVYYDYWYYPDVQVYFDYNRRVYFYFSNNSWIEAPVLPLTLRARLGGYVPIHSRYNRPYIEHNEIIRKYPSHYRDERRPPEYHDNRYEPNRRDYNEMPRKEPPVQPRTWEQRVEQQRIRDEDRNQQRHDSYGQPPKSGVKLPVRQRLEEPRKEPVKAAHDKAKVKNTSKQDAKQKKAESKDRQDDQDKDRRGYRQ